MSARATTRRGLTIEIAGVAGTGKSTLAGTLMRRLPTCRAADTLHTRAPAHWPYVVRSLPRLVPLAAASARARPGLDWEELKLVAYIGEWHRFLRSRDAGPATLTVLDQGPVFALARLLWSGKPVTRTEPFRRWMRLMAERWSGEIDAIAWLDAPDAVLLGRIDGRQQPHQAKGVAEGEARALLASHRRAYDEVLGVLRARGRPPVIRFDTGDATAEEIASYLACLLRPGHPGPAAALAVVPS